MSATTSSPRSKRTALVAAVALAAGTVGAASVAPASGTVLNVRPGKSITVFHNLDFVAIAGYRLGRVVTVRVLRNGVTVGSVTAPATIVPGGLSGLEVNHGPETTTVFPGDCWDGHTPDIRPGDHIVVTDGAGRDEVVVDDIQFTGRPSEVAPDGDIVVPFVARYGVNGAAIPVDRIDSAEFRLDQLRYEAADITVEARPGGADGEYQMRYVAPFAPSRGGVDDGEDPTDPNAEPPLTQQQIRSALLGDGHTIGFGHVDPAPAEAMLVEGLADTTGPAPGCERAPSTTDALTTVTPSVINAGTPADRPLHVAGFSQNATDVVVRLSSATGDATKPAAITGTDRQTWKADFAAEEIAGLSGNVRVEVVVDGAQLSGARTVLKDTDAPDAPTVSVAAGTYRGVQRVTLRAGGSDRVRYTLGQAPGAPTRSRGKVYRGGQLTIARSSTLRMIAVDEAGNVSPVTSARYTIRRAPSAPVIRPARRGKPRGVSAAIAKWSPPQSLNGSRLTGYRVATLSLRPTGAVASRRWSKVLPARARSLRVRLPEGRYRFQVRALSSLGASPLSRASNAVRPR